MMKPMMRRKQIKKIVVGIIYSKYSINTKGGLRNNNNKNDIYNFKYKLSKQRIYSMKHREEKSIDVNDVDYTGLCSGIHVAFGFGTV